MSGQAPYDLLVVGGGINGAGIARDAAGRGLKVLLVERDDLASHTSSWSSKLVHGGLRYLENYEFGLVRKALIEREVLLRSAPHIIWPLTFVLPHSPEQRPAWLIRLGLFLYDHLGGRELLPGSTSVDLAKAGPFGDCLKDWVKRGFTYSDAWVMDSRLVVLNAMDARELGADIRTRTTCISAKREGTLWTAELEDRDAVRQSVQARALINAAGPWVQNFIEADLKLKSDRRVRLVKGSHIVVPKLHEGDHPYILQNTDKRIVFVIPYEGEFSLIGTTDVAYQGSAASAAITDDETDYLCAVVNRYFENEITPEDVVWAYSGVRPLLDDASGNVSAVTRDYAFDIDQPAEGGAPLLSIFGGKITTYRRLAEHALAKLKTAMPFEAGEWTAGSHLPGGDIANADFDAFFDGFQRQHAWLDRALARRLARHYGTRATRILEFASSMQGLGECLGGNLYEAELRYLVDNEWVMSAEDALWRRTKLGLHLSDAEKNKVVAWFEHATEAHERELAN